jgi:hypothetical protein
MKKLFSIIFSFVLLTGCYKRDELHVNETCNSGCAIFNIVVSTGNNSATPVSNAYVELSWSDVHPESFFGNPSRLIAKGYTDNSGKIRFAFKAIGNEFTSGAFHISAKSTTDYIAAYRGFYDIKKYDTILNYNMHLPAKAFLKLVFKNFAPTGNNDFFEAEPYFRSYGSDPFIMQMTSPDQVNYPSVFFYGNQKPFTRLEFTGQTAGDQYTYFDVIKKRNGNRTDSRDSIYIAKGQTGTYEVDFQ